METKANYVLIGTFTILVTAFLLGFALGLQIGRRFFGLKALLFELNGPLGRFAILFDLFGRAFGFHLVACGARRAFPIGVGDLAGFWVGAAHHLAGCRQRAAGSNRQQGDWFPEGD